MNLIKAIDDAKFTRGEWVINKLAKHTEIINTNHGICDLFHDDDQDIANAHLISAAPDLLEVVKLMLEDSREVPDWVEITQKAETAVKKALGI